MRKGGCLILFAALVLLAMLATGRCTSVAQELTLSAMAPYPTWTPRPTATPRVYASWTLAPTATRKTSTPRPVTVTATRTLAPSRTPTYDGMPPSATPTALPYGAPWPFSFRERQRIVAAALLALADGPDPDAEPFTDQVLSIGVYEEELGAPLSRAFAVQADSGKAVHCRAFALGVVAVPDTDAVGLCTPYAVVKYSGEIR